MNKRCSRDTSRKFQRNVVLFIRQCKPARVIIVHTPEFVFRTSFCSCTSSSSCSSSSSSLSSSSFPSASAFFFLSSCSSSFLLLLLLLRRRRRRLCSNVYRHTGSVSHQCTVTDHHTTKDIAVKYIYRERKIMACVTTSGSTLGVILKKTITFIY